jgi:hypothetical protein
VHERLCAMAKRRRHGGKLCAYCGVRLGVTSDHPIPTCLFIPPLPPDMVTVPACEPCNNLKARDEEYLRDVLVSDIYSSGHPVAQALADGKLTRAIRQNRSEFARVAVRHMAHRPLYTPGGIYLGDYPTVPLDGPRLLGALSLIVRGLYFQLVKRVFPDGYTFDIRRVHQLSIPLAWASMQKARANGPYRLGEDVFVCMFFYATEDPGITFWLLSFYSGYMLKVVTEPIASNPMHA